MKIHSGRTNMIFHYYVIYALSAVLLYSCLRRYFAAICLSVWMVISLIMHVTMLQLLRGCMSAGMYDFAIFNDIAVSRSICKSLDGIMILAAGVILFRMFVKYQEKQCIL